MEQEGQTLIRPASTIYVPYVCSKACGTPWVIMAESLLAQTHMNCMHLHALCWKGTQIIDMRTGDVHGHFLIGLELSKSSAGRAVATDTAARIQLLV